MKALALARACGRGVVEGNTLCNLGWVAHLRGDEAQSVQHSTAALKVARHLGHPRVECVALCNLAIAKEKMGASPSSRSTSGSPRAS